MNKLKILFIHGLEGSSQGNKAKMLRNIFSEILIPDFSGPLAQRMELLTAILSETGSWILIGSSFGGLMAALYGHQFPGQADKLILLAPALVWPEFVQLDADSISTPTTIFHGICDEVIPIKNVQELAERVFTNLEFHAVKDDHTLHETARNIDWKAMP